jgi:hypothetical protein
VLGSFFEIKHVRIHSSSNEIHDSVHIDDSSCFMCHLIAEGTLASLLYRPGAMMDERFVLTFRDVLQNVPTMQIGRELTSDAVSRLSLPDFRE